MSARPPLDVVFKRFESESLAHLRDDLAAAGVLLAPPRGAVLAHAADVPRPGAVRLRA